MKDIEKDLFQKAAGNKTISIKPVESSVLSEDKLFPDTAILFLRLAWPVSVLP